MHPDNLWAIDKAPPSVVNIPFYPLSQFLESIPVWAREGNTTIPPTFIHPTILARNYVHGIGPVHHETKAERCVCEACGWALFRDNRQSESSRLMQKCSICRGIRYCCSACQKEHWPTHKLECKGLTDVPNRHDVSMPSLVHTPAPSENEQP